MNPTTPAYRRHDVAAIALTCAALGDSLTAIAAGLERAPLPAEWAERVREVEGRVRTAEPGDVG